MFEGIDLFSDTATRPTRAMKEAMMNAPLGDEQIGEDPTTKQLETVMAEKLGKSAALFVPSATMANQLALRLQVQPGEEIIADENCHIFNAEGGGAAFHSHAQTRMIPTKDGIFGAHEIEKRFRRSLVPHAPKSALVIVENTTNAGGGYSWPLSTLADVIQCSKELGLKLHLDGSRIFNAAAKEQCDVSVLTRDFDTVTVCFSKGLGCPMGAILGFDEHEYPRLRRLKQVFGGSMRQSGMLAAAALYALSHHVDDLVLDHEKAINFAKGLGAFPEILVENPNPSTNMVFFSLKDHHLADDFYAEMLKSGVRCSRSSFNRFRAVMHRDINLKQISEAVALIGSFFS